MCMDMLKYKDTYLKSLKDGMSGNTNSVTAPIVTSSSPYYIDLSNAYNVGLFAYDIGSAIRSNGGGGGGSNNTTIPEHNHDDRYAKIVHDHDGRYYTKLQIDEWRDRLINGDLLFNKINANHIQAGTIVAGSTIIANGAIGSAQISKVSADKIDAGIIDTSRVTIAGANGNLKLRGNRLQVFEGIGSNQYERVSLGDVNNDGTVYGLRVRGSDGNTILYDENGVYREGITDGSINNDKIAGDANIDGGKLNIHSVITNINENNTGTIHGTKVDIDGESITSKIFNIEFNQNEHSETIERQQSEINQNKEQIELKVSNQKYQEDMSSMTSRLEKNESDIEVLNEGIKLTVSKTELQNQITEVKDFVADEIGDISVGGANYLNNSAPRKATVDELITWDRTLNGTRRLTYWQDYNEDVELPQVGYHPHIDLETFHFPCIAFINRNATFNMANRELSLKHEIYKSEEVIIPNETYTISFDAYSDTSLFSFHGGLYHKVVESSNYGYHSEWMDIFIPQECVNTWKRYSFTFTTHKGINTSEPIYFIISGHNNPEGSGYVKNIKLEKSNIVSQWTPSQFDIDDSLNDVVDSMKDYTNESITELNSSINISLDGISNRVSKVEKDNDSLSNSFSELDIKVDGITNRVSSVESNQNNIKSDLTNLDIKVDGISSKVSSVESITNSTANGLTSLTDRVSVAESKLTKDSLTTIIGDHYTTSETVDGIVTSKDYQTSSQVQQTVNSLEVKVSQSGGYNLIYNGDFKRRLECWDANSDSWQYGEDEWTPNGRYIACVGELNTAKTLYVKNAMAFDKNAEAYTLSYWINTSTSGEDGTTNPYRRAELTVYYDDGSASWHSAGNQTRFATWEKHIVTVRKPPDKGFSHFALGLWCRDTTKKVHYSMVMVEKGVMANEWSPNPNEIYDGITTIDNEGIKVTATNTDTYTEMDASSFRVSDNNGGTVAEFSQSSRIPDLSAGIITANEVYANNLVKKSTYVKNYYVAGGYGNDKSGAGGSWHNPCKTVQYVLDNYVEDILDYDVNIYVGESVPGWTCKSKSGKGVITFLIQDDCIVRDPLYLDNCTNRIAVNGTNEKKGTFMTGIVVTGCPNFDIGWVSFRGKNWAHNSGSCNVLIRSGSKGIVRFNDFNGCSYAIIVDNNSELWVYHNIGSDITHYIGIGAYTTIYNARSGYDRCPDFTSHYYADAGHSNLYHIHDGANYEKTPSIGWSPSYTPTQKTQTWNFNKIWSDETLHGWSDRQELIQGYSSTWNTGRWTGYMQMTDGMSAIRSAISGGTNLSGRIYVQRTSSSGNSTGSKLCLYASDGTLITNSTTINRSQGVWVSLSSAIILKIQSGAITYFYLKADANNSSTYFKCQSNAKIEITYTN